MANIHAKSQKKSKAVRRGTSRPISSSAKPSFKRVEEDTSLCKSEELSMFIANSIIKDPSFKNVRIESLEDMYVSPSGNTLTYVIDKLSPLELLHAHRMTDKVPGTTVMNYLTYRLSGYYPSSIPNMNQLIDMTRSIRNLPIDNSIKNKVLMCPVSSVLPREIPRNPNVIFNLPTSVAIMSDSIQASFNAYASMYPENYSSLDYPKMFVDPKHLANPEMIQNLLMLNNKGMAVGWYMLMHSKINSAYLKKEMGVSSGDIRNTHVGMLDEMLSKPDTQESAANVTFVGKLRFMTNLLPEISVKTLSGDVAAVFKKIRSREDTVDVHNEMHASNATIHATRRVLNSSIHTVATNSRYPSTMSEGIPSSNNLLKRSMGYHISIKHPLATYPCPLLSMPAGYSVPAGKIAGWIASRMHKVHINTFPSTRGSKVENTQEYRLANILHHNAHVINLNNGMAHPTYFTAKMLVNTVGMLSSLYLLTNVGSRIRPEAMNAARLLADAAHNGLPRSTYLEIAPLFLRSARQDLAYRTEASKTYDHMMSYLHAEVSKSNTNELTSPIPIVEDVSSQILAQVRGSGNIHVHNSYFCMLELVMDESGNLHIGPNSTVIKSSTPKSGRSSVKIYDSVSSIQKHVPVEVLLPAVKTALGTCGNDTVHCVLSRHNVFLQGVNISALVPSHNGLATNEDKDNRYVYTSDNLKVLPGRLDARVSNLTFNLNPMSDYHVQSTNNFDASTFHEEPVFTETEVGSHSYPYARKGARIYTLHTSYDVMGYMMNTLYSKILSVSPNGEFIHVIGEGVSTRLATLLHPYDATLNGVQIQDKADILISPHLHRLDYPVPPNRINTNYTGILYSASYMMRDTWRDKEELQAVLAAFTVGLRLSKSINLAILSIHNNPSVEKPWFGISSPSHPLGLGGQTSGSLSIVSSGITAIVGHTSRSAAMESNDVSIKGRDFSPDAKYLTGILTEHSGLSSNSKYRVNMMYGGIGVPVPNSVIRDICSRAHLDIPPLKNVSIDILMREEGQISPSRRVEGIYHLSNRNLVRRQSVSIHQCQSAPMRSDAYSVLPMTGVGYSDITMVDYDIVAISMGSARAYGIDKDSGRPLVRARQASSSFSMVMKNDVKQFYSGVIKEKVTVPSYYNYDTDSFKPLFFSENTSFVNVMSVRKVEDEYVVRVHVTDAYAPESSYLLEVKVKVNLLDPMPEITSITARRLAKTVVLPSFPILNDYPEALGNHDGTAYKAMLNRLDSLSVLDDNFKYLKYIEGYGVRTLLPTSLVGSHSLRKSEMKMISELMGICEAGANAQNVMDAIRANIDVPEPDHFTLGA